MFAPILDRAVKCSVMGTATGQDADDGQRRYPRARRPDRSWRIDADGLSLAACEWGDPADPPLLLAHGGFDFAGTMDVFAPLLAAGGWRVVSWDQRGHGDSDRAVFYRWEADMRDALAVFADVADGPVPVVGHSKGGSLMTHIAGAMPHLVSAVVNMDGIPSRRNMPDVQDHERTTMMAKEVTAWLDHRRRAATAQRRPGTLDELAERRAVMNPRLSHDWLTYIATIGAYPSDDGWRWKIDPSMRMGGFGPFRPEWSLQRIAEVGQPFLAILATEPETMGFGTQVDDVLPYLPPRGRVEALVGVGHFVHIEQPDRVAELALDHLAPFHPGGVR